MSKPCEWAEKQQKCVADAAPGSRYCAVHDKFTIAGSNMRCRKCMKTIRSGSWALKRADGGVEHTPSCPPSASTPKIGDQYAAAASKA